MHSTQVHRVIGSGDLVLAARQDGARAAASGRCSLVSAAAIYLLNVLISLALGLARIHLAAAAAARCSSRSPVTALMTWLVMPRAARLLQNWLYAPHGAPDRAGGGARPQ